MGGFPSLVLRFSPPLTDGLRLSGNVWALCRSNTSKRKPAAACVSTDSCGWRCVSEACLRMDVLLQMALRFRGLLASQMVVLRFNSRWCVSQALQMPCRCGCVSPCWSRPISTKENEITIPDYSSRLTHCDTQRETHAGCVSPCEYTWVHEYSSNFVIKCKWYLFISLQKTTFQKATF